MHVYYVQCVEYADSQTIVLKLTNYQSCIKYLGLKYKYDD